MQLADEQILAHFSPIICHMEAPGKCQRINADEKRMSAAAQYVVSNNMRRCSARSGYNSI